MRVYAHALREEETDLSLADFVAGGSGRLQASPVLADDNNPLISLVGRPGLEPGTNGLKARCSAS